MANDRQLANAKEEIFKLLIDRMPNYVPGIVILQRISDFDEGTLQKAINALLEEEKIIPFGADREVRKEIFSREIFSSVQPNPYPGRTTITIGGCDSTENKREPRFRAKSLDEVSEFR